MNKIVRWLTACSISILFGSLAFSQAPVVDVVPSTATPPVLTPFLKVPNPALTPGAVRPLTLAVICKTKWGLDRRHVTPKMKTQIAANYGMKTTDIVAKGKGPCCEYDHLIPREIGGADDVKNLWPQPWEEASMKDPEENAMHKAICATPPTISLVDAQMKMANWGRTKP